MQRIEALQRSRPAQRAAQLRADPLGGDLPQQRSCGPREAHRVTIEPPRPTSDRASEPQHPQRILGHRRWAADALDAGGEIVEAAKLIDDVEAIERRPGPRGIDRRDRQRVHRGVAPAQVGGEAGGVDGHHVDLEPSGCGDAEAAVPIGEREAGCVERLPDGAGDLGDVAVHRKVEIERRRHAQQRVADGSADQPTPAGRGLARDGERAARQLGSRRDAHWRGIRGPRPQVIS